MFTAVYALSPNRESILLKKIQSDFPIDANRIVSELMRDERIDNIDTKLKNTYRLSYFKNINKDLKPMIIKENVDKLITLKNYNYIIKNLIKSLDITFDGLKYLSDFVLKCQISQLNQMSEEKRKLHVVAFLHVSYYYLNDILADTLLREVQADRNSEKIKYEEHRASVRNIEANKTNSVLMDVKEVLLPFRLKIFSILANEDLEDKEKVATALEECQLRSDRIQKTESDINSVYDDTVQIMNQIDRNGIIEKCSLKLIKRVNSIILNLEFEYQYNNSLLTSAIRYYKNNNGLIDSGCPQGFLKQNVKDILYRENGTFRQSLYKSLLFREIALAIKSGELNILHSLKYKEFDQFIFSENETKENKIFELSGMDKFSDPINIHKKLVQELESQYENTNSRINDGSNKHIRFRDDGKFILKTDKIDFEDQFKVSSLVPNNYSINITELLNSVNSYAKFTNAFVHFSSKYIARKPSIEAMIATTISLGCGIGLGKMEKISRNIKVDFENIATVYFSVENLKQANIAILKAIDKMPLSTIYNTDIGCHTSSDGAKYDVTKNSLDCSPTYKNQGSGSGVSVYVFTDHSHKMFYSIVMNSNEREAVYVIDGLMENDFVHSDIHSTDTHGYSEIIFATTNLLGYRFAPRIKNLKKQRIYSFSKRSDHVAKGHKILPSGTINFDLISKYWDMILRFVATIKLKKCSASDLFRRLNSYSSNSPFYHALKEYGRIIKSLFILDYIDNHELRQKIEKQLNKVESIQKFSRAILVTGKYDFSSNIREEQSILEGCKRLIQNSVLCWNYMYLSKLISQCRDYGKKTKLLNLIRNGSPVFWKHVNFLGIYDFSAESIKCKSRYIYRDLESIKI